MSYLGFLDQSSLFHLLVRMHYPDLISLCKTKNYLWKLFVTPHFQKKWKKYNITKISTDQLGSFKEVDRLNVQHGLSKQHKDELQFIEGKLQSMSGPLHTNLCNYIGDDLYETVTTTLGYQICHYMHKNSALNGLFREYDLDGSILWNEYKQGDVHGMLYDWWPNGSLKKMAQYCNDKRHGFRKCFYETGKKRVFETYIHGRRDTVTRWHPSGTLYDN